MKTKNQINISISVQVIEIYLKSAGTEGNH